MLIINNIPISYRNALFSSISNIVPGTKVVFLAETETVRGQIELRHLENVDYRILKPLFRTRDSRTTTSDRIGVVIPARMVSDSDSVLAFGYSYAAIVMAIAQARLFGKRTTLFCESTLWDTRKRGLQAAIKPYLLSGLFQSFLAPGVDSADYLMSLGVDHRRITIAANAVSPEFHRSSRRRATPEKGQPIRVGLIGRLAPEKRFAWAIRALVGVDNYIFFVAGEGDQKAEIQELSRSHPVSICGHLSKERLLELYSELDVVLLPSESEPWGFVVNEAIAAGCPVVLSDRVGARAAVVPQAGQSFSAGDEVSLKSAMQTVVNSLETYSEGALLLAKELTVEKQARTIVEHMRTKF
ncbi:MAG: glycosyltransferase family 4 protein [Mesorhizobium sp.]|uniref:glycosyltransferase family 4 protein n=1 Tax=Mesorhizobium sp. TaxID=1871066 RepID=UPI000FE753FE|nr:glycosyltransferase family 4 protein [Mesorhizobium sp.]RWP65912.1 MAG: glycosyltransferase [Mesorhizobium sp.]TIL90081.1 MAG: glycosyltransferase family 4 protein [Mesorhizobium sp.]TIM01817.1 MAG: glycosyltransferase family 4 protein [Mesorhizobium sp.]TIM77326.1 MAG: glycosyltransferase family 4 protein [Mesorhizobium sp.]